MALARRVAARWGFLQATKEYVPPIPRWALERAAIRLAFVDTKEPDALLLAKESVNILLPKFLEMLRKKMGERYYMNASQANGRIFYYFAPRQPVDSFHLMVGSKQGKVFLNLSYMPHRLDGSPDFSNSRQVVQVVEDPELAGLDFMRVTRQLFTKMPSS